MAAYKVDQLYIDNIMADGFSKKLFVDMLRAIFTNSWIACLNIDAIYQQSNIKELIIYLYQLIRTDQAKEFIEHTSKFEPEHVNKICPILNGGKYNFTRVFPFFKLLTVTEGGQPSADFIRKELLDKQYAIFVGTLQLYMYYNYVHTTHR